MMKCPRRLWPRSVINSRVSLEKVCRGLVLSDHFYRRHVNEGTLCPSSAQIQGIKLMVRWLLGVKNNQSKSGNSTLRMLTAILHSDGDLTEQGRMG